MDSITCRVADKTTSLLGIYLLVPQNMYYRFALDSSTTSCFFTLCSIMFVQGYFVHGFGYTRFVAGDRR